MKLKENFSYVLMLIAVTISLMAVGYSHGLFTDEREHLYATYMITQGYIPYLDYFEHHHPLMWYLFAPLVYLLDGSINIWAILRSCAIGILLITALYVYKTIVALTQNTKLGFIGIAWYLGNNVVAWAGTEYRPDNLMVMFHTMGLYYLLDYLKNKKISILQIAGMCFYLSFLALQKTIVSWVPLGAVVLYFLYRGDMKWKDLGIVAVFPILFSVVFLLKLYQLDILEEYWELNWLLNSKQTVFSAAPDLLFILPTVASVFALYYLCSKRENVYVKSFAFLYLVTVLLLMVILPLGGISYWFSQYFLPIYPLMAVVMALAIRPFMKYGKILSVALLGVTLYYANFAGGAVAKYYTELYGLRTAKYLESIIYAHSDKNDKILCNLDWAGVGGFRQCAQGYFFFSYDQKSAEYSFKFKRKPLPRLNNIIKARKPKIVANNYWSECQWDEKAQKPKCQTNEQKLDEKWMEEFYTNNGFIWIRKY